jgi:hypothetical protein
MFDDVYACVILFSPFHSHTALCFHSIYLHFYFILIGHHFSFYALFCLIRILPLFYLLRIYFFCIIEFKTVSHGLISSPSWLTRFNYYNVLMHITYTMFVNPCTNSMSFEICPSRDFCEMKIILAKLNVGFLSFYVIDFYFKATNV